MESKSFWTHTIWKHLYEIRQQVRHMQFDIHFDTHSYPAWCSTWSYRPQSLYTSSQYLFRHTNLTLSKSTANTTMWNRHQFWQTPFWHAFRHKKQPSNLTTLQFDINFDTHFYPPLPSFICLSYYGYIDDSCWYVY